MDLRFIFGLVVGATAVELARAPGFELETRARNAGAGWGWKLDHETPIAGWRAMLGRLGLLPHEVEQLIAAARALGPGQSRTVGDIFRAAKQVADAQGHAQGLATLKQEAAQQLPGSRLQTVADIAPTWAELAKAR